MATKIKLKKTERKFLKEFVLKGVKKAREIARANILLLADKGQNTNNISKVTGIHRQRIWRVKKRYLDDGLKAALEEKPRSGQPVKYDDKKKAEIIATACTTPPVGSNNWSVRLLVEEFKNKKGFDTINREVIRLILKKAKQNPG